MSIKIKNQILYFMYITISYFIINVFVEDDAKKKWKNLRDTFLREVKKVKKKPIWRCTRIC